MKDLGEIKKLESKQKEFPSFLKSIPNPPENLYLLGEIKNLEGPCISLVGTRKATYEGKLIAKKIAKDLAEKGFIIVSGLALGIDSAVHQGALTAGGKTIAVLANGLDIIYPKANENLAKEIIKNSGTIISEYPIKTPPLPHQFLERNRIISGLSFATVIIEAPIHSGALVTARHALEQGREIFVVPGPALNKNYQGSHLLIRYGARLVTSAEEILEDLQNSSYRDKLPQKEKTEIENESKEDQLILKILKEMNQPLTIDKIIEITNLEPYIVNQRLTFLLFEGKIIEKNGRFQLNYR